MSFFKKIAVLLVSLVVAGCTPNASNANVCEQGYSLASGGRFQESISLLSVCLASTGTTSETRRQAYEARAWPYSNLNDATAAVYDQEAAFAIVPAGSHREFINYASYLRAAGRIGDSLTPLRAAEAMDRAAGGVSMMTQYNLGWTLQELGLHEQAIAAFSKGVPVQPAYAFVYYRRGLSLEALGRNEAARADFERLAKLLRETPGVEGKSGIYLHQIREKLKQYGIQE